MIVLIKTNNHNCLCVVDKFVKFKFGMYITKCFNNAMLLFRVFLFCYLYFSTFHYEPKVLK